MRSLYVLLLCSIMGAACCPAPRTGSGVTDPRVEASRKELHSSIDRISDLAYQHDRLQEQVWKMKGRDMTNSEAGLKHLRDLLETLLIEENGFRESVSALSGELD